MSCDEERRLQGLLDDLAACLCAIEKRGEKNICLRLRFVGHNILEDEWPYAPPIPGPCKGCGKKGLFSWHELRYRLRKAGEDAGNRNYELDIFDPGEYILCVDCYSEVTRSGKHSK